MDCFCWVLVEQICKKKWMCASTIIPQIHMDNIITTWSIFGQPIIYCFILQQDLYSSNIGNDLRFGIYQRFQFESRR